MDHVQTFYIENTISKSTIKVQELFQKHEIVEITRVA